MPSSMSPPTPEAARDAISIEGVSKKFSRQGVDTQALSPLDLRIAEGEFVAIVGPSGCGKSTLMRIIAGLTPPTTGRVFTNGKLVDKAVAEVGIVFQQPTLLNWRNVLDNVLVQVELRGMRARDYADQARSLLTAVGLGDFLHAYPHELSGGMRQRAAIVRALIHDPALLLMDEPFGALDALTREQMRIDLEVLWMRARKTVVFVTHGIDEAVLLADRVVVMSPRPGRIEKIIDVNLTRPRALGARKNPEFINTTEMITQLFLSRGILQAGGTSAH